MSKLWPWLGSTAKSLLLAVSYSRRARVFSRDGKYLYMSNFELNLPWAGVQAAIDSAWTSWVKYFTVSRLPAEIPALDDGDNERERHDRAPLP